MSCRSGARSVSFTVTAVDPIRSASLQFELLPIPSPIHREIYGSTLWMAATEVTQRQWTAVMGSNPSSPRSKFGGARRGSEPDYPVHNVSLCDSIVFANRLSERDGLTPAYAVPAGFVADLRAESCNALAGSVEAVAGADGYRFPTRQEQRDSNPYHGNQPSCETANLREGSDISPLKRDTVAITCDDHFPGLAPVASLSADANRVYDLRGNVAEWGFELHEREAPSRGGGSLEPETWDVFGADWSTPAWASIYARPMEAGESDAKVGLRVVRSVPGPT